MSRKRFLKKRKALEEKREKRSVFIRKLVKIAENLWDFFEVFSEIFEIVLKTTFKQLSDR